MLQQEILREINAAPFGERKFIVSRVAKALGISEQSVYRALRKVKGKSKEIEKKPMKDQDNIIVKEVARLKTYGMIGTQSRELSTDICIDILKERGFENIELTKASINRRLNQLGFRQKDIIVRVESEYANQTHQLDFSRSKYFQLFKYDSEKGDYLIKATTKQLTYKEHDTSLRTWYVGLVDAFSRAALAQCYAATGESVLIGIEFLNFAYTRVDDTHPLCFLPDKLKTDNGAFIKNKAVQDFLMKYQIISELVKPMKKRGIQKQESMFKTLWRQFELPLYTRVGEGFTIWLSEFNELIHQFMVQRLENEHPVRTGETIGHLYRTSLMQREQRAAGDDMRITLNRYYKRKIDDALCISIDKQKYQCTSDKINSISVIDKWVSVWINLNGEAVAEFLEEPGKPFLLKPVDGFVKEGDFSHRYPPSFRQQIENEITKQKVAYLKPRKQTVSIENKFEDAVSEQEFFPNEFEAKKYIAEQFGRNASYKTYAEIFDPLIAVTLDKNLIDQKIQEVKTKVAI